ncbi:MAG: hypothetical protein M1814_004207 [Vezdaea aestivalis]|nr:MAG: hypothetical protein M1814_004207 [Vezdaea aestivalis]
MAVPARKAMESFSKDTGTVLRVLSRAMPPKNEKKKTTTRLSWAESLIDPEKVTSLEGEKQLLDMGVIPVGSRRRRRALELSADLPFEQLPYQCFQEARKILRDDRERKLQQIAVQRKRITQAKAQVAADGMTAPRARQLKDMNKQLVRLKVLADSNDPLVKRRFEDGIGDMNKPIYRHLARKKWESYRKKLIDQRISQFHLVPDLLPKLEVTADVHLSFGRRNIEAGAMVPTAVSSIPPRLQVHLYDPGERLVTIAVVDPDVPNPEEDRHAYRCHYLAANIPISPSDGSIALPDIIDRSQLALSWLPPFAQKGDRYHRLAVFVLEQEAGARVNVSKIVGGKRGREGFRLRSLIQTASLTPIGAHIFRTQWDDSTALVMAQSAIPGADIEFRPKPRAGPLHKPQLPLKKMKNRGILPSKRLWIPYHKGSTPPMNSKQKG